MRCSSVLALFAAAASSVLAAPLPNDRYAALADVALAKRNCDVMPSKVDKEMTKIVYKTVLKHTKDPKVMLITFITAYRESMFNNLMCGDKASIGLFQQQWTMGWGSISELHDPVYATNKFLSALDPIYAKHPDLGAGVLAQMVQQAEAGEKYTENIPIGQKLIAETKAALGDNSGDDEPAPAPKPDPKPEPKPEPAPQPEEPPANGGTINVGGNPNDDSGDNNGSDDEGCDDSLPKCTQYYTPIPGDNCYKVSAKHGLDLSAFYELNPEIDNECQNLYAGKEYCVAVESK